MIVYPKDERMFDISAEVIEVARLKRDASPADVAGALKEAFYNELESLPYKSVRDCVNPVLYKDWKPVKCDRLAVFQLLLDAKVYGRLMRNLGCFFRHDPSSTKIFAGARYLIEFIRALRKILHKDLWEDSKTVIDEMVWSTKRWITDHQEQGKILDDMMKFMDIAQDLLITEGQEDFK